MRKKSAQSSQETPSDQPPSLPDDELPKPALAKKPKRQVSPRQVGNLIQGDYIEGDKVLGNKIIQTFNNYITQVKDLPNWVKILLILILLVVVATLSLQIRTAVQAATRPQKMTGTFNIAVAAFDEISNGKRRTSDQGVMIGNWLVDQLKSQASSYPPGTVVEIWGPDLTGRVNGDSPKELSANAEGRGQKIHADVLVYGTIQGDSDGYIITPQFYVENNNFQYAQELTGPHFLGSSLSYVDDPFQNSGLRSDVSAGLSVRAQALAHFTDGLVNYYNGQFDKAFDEFNEAKNVTGWKDNQGKEVVYLFLGNARLNQQRYPDALDYFHQALSLNPNYSRAYLGIGFTLFQQAIQGMASPTNGPPNLDLLMQSIEQFQAGVKATDQPENADIPWKAHLGIGRAYLVMGQAVDETYYAQALSELNQVIQAYEVQQVRYVELAAQSYSLVGLIDSLYGKNDEAITAFNKAIEISKDFSFRAQWAKKLSQLYTEKGDSAKATEFNDKSQKFKLMAASAGQ